MGGANSGAWTISYSTAFFEREEDLLRAARETRLRGVEVEDVYTPYAIHGMEEAAGMRPSRLPAVSLIAGIAGLVFALIMQIWTSAVDWPLNIGGKPFNSLPAFIPITFELTVLFSGIASLVALFIKGRLWFENRRRAIERVTDDRFVLVLKQSDASIDPRRLRDLLRRLGAVEVIEGELPA